MHTVRIEGTFSSAHNLRGYTGKCEALHGHNWKVMVEARARKLDKLGMVIDFTVMKKRLAEVLEELDHRYLNDIPYFKRYNPTSEHLAKYFYDRLRKGIPGIYAVTVWESDRASATYHG